MGGFNFRLQKVLEHRERKEDEKKQTFVNARHEYLREKEILDTMYSTLDGCMNDTTEKSTGIFTYIAKHNYITFLEERIEDQIKKVRIYEEKMDEKKIEFQQSQKDRKVIDKLKENAHREYKINMDRLEQKQNDEFALYGYVRK